MGQDALDTAKSVGSKAANVVKNLTGVGEVGKIRDYLSGGSGGGSGEGMTQAPAMRHRGMNYYREDDGK